MGVGLAVGALVSCTHTKHMPRYTSYFQDDDVDAPTGRSGNVSGTRDMSHTATLGFGQNFKEDAEYDQLRHARTDTTKPSGRNDGSSTHHHTTPNTGKKAARKALHETLKMHFQQMHKALQESDSILRGMSMSHHSSVVAMLDIRDACLHTHKELNEKFKMEHREEMQANTNAVAKHQRLPHPGLRKKRIFAVHSGVHTTDQLEKIAEDVASIVMEYRTGREELNCPLPKHVPGTPNEYYILPLIHYMARLKYRVIEALLDKPSENHKLRVNSRKIKDLKEKITAAKKNLAGMRSSKKRKPREAWVLPDHDMLPPQKPRVQNVHTGKPSHHDDDDDAEKHRGHRKGG